MRQILALDLDGVDMSLIDKARLKLSSDHVARSPELDSYQLNVKIAVSLYPCYHILYVCMCTQDFRMGRGLYLEFWGHSLCIKI